MTDDADTIERRSKRSPPIVQQVREHRVEILLGGIPRLHEIVVQSDLVDGADGGFSVRVRREQHPLGVGEYPDGHFEELHT